MTVNGSSAKEHLYCFSTPSAHLRLQLSVLFINDTSHRLINDTTNTVTQSHSHTVTQSHSHTVTKSHSLTNDTTNTVTQSHSHTVTQSHSLINDTTTNGSSAEEHLYCIPIPSTHLLLYLFGLLPQCSYEQRVAPQGSNR